MSKVMIIGAGGVGNVVAQKCAQLPEVFSDIILASRTESKCKKNRTGRSGKNRCYDSHGSSGCG